MNPGTEALLFVPRPTLRVLAVRVSRVWRSVGGTERVEVAGGREQLRGSFDARQLLPLSALENLPAASAENPPLQKMAGAGAASLSLPNPKLAGAKRPA